MAGYRQGTPEENLARALTDETLALRLETLARSPRRLDAALRRAVLNEAARRLRWEQRRQNAEDIGAITNGEAV